MKLSTLSASKTSSVCLFGPPKAGKTLLAGKLASDFNLLWFDLENGHETLFQLPTASQERIDLISLPDTRSYPIAIETLLKVIKGNECKICNKHGKVSCMMCQKDGSPVSIVCLNETPQDTIVVFDSLTQLTNSAIANITKNQPEDYKLDYDDWGNLGKLMDIFLSHFQQAKYNRICITHELGVKKLTDQEIIVPLSGTTNFSRNTAKYFDHVVHCDRKNKKHVAFSATDYSIQILTGSRTAVKLEDYSEPTLLPIFKGDYKEPDRATIENPISANSLLSKLNNRK